jgi:carbonic anhydrase/acetyltransferase-like protein (isoleucine patch superfamily)
MSEHQEKTGQDSAQPTTDEATLRRYFPHRYLPTRLDPSVFVAPGAHVYGDVAIGRDSSVWFNSVIRGDVNYIRVGERTNIQDLTLIHVSHHGDPCIVGNDSTIGHSVTLHACTIGNFALIGMQSAILDGAEIGDFVLLGAGSLVPPGKKIPAGVKAFGRPAKVVGELSAEEIERIRWSAGHYVNLAKTYR